jgi:Rrf2 family iron-sulfur cluster assembly transcriptional regulator
MTFSRSCEYALQSVLFIAVKQSGGAERVPLQNIAKSQGIPMHFLSKVLQVLVRGKVLHSLKGPRGGFALRNAASDLTLLEVVRVIDGLDMFDRCGIGLRACSDASPCPVHHEYKIIKNRVRQVLSQKTIADLARDVERGVAIINFKK